jgi:hypothetical protein
VITRRAFDTPQHQASGIIHPVDLSAMS